MPDTLTGVFALMRLLPAVNRAKAASAAVGIALASMLPIAVAAATGMVIATIPDTLDAGLSSPAGRRLLTWLAVVGALALAQQVLSPVVRTLGETLGREVDRHLQERVMAAVGRPAGMAHLTDPEVLAGLRVVRGLGLADNDRPSLAVEALVAVVPAWLRALVAAAALLAFHWWLGLIWLVTWPVVVYYMQREYFRVGQVGFGQSSALQQAEYVRDLAITRSAAKEIRIWGMLDWLVVRFGTSWRAAMEPIWRERRPRARVVLGATGAIAGVNLVSYAVLVWAAVHHDLGLAGLAVYTQALALANNYTAFDDANAHLSFAAASVPRVMDLDTHAGPASGSAAGRTAELPEVFPAERIQFSGVRFRYPGTDQDALNGVDLTIDAGHSLAIVGDNGAGKSSLVKILCGLYTPTAGAVNVDGRELSGVDPAAWRARIGVLFQDFAKYHLTVAENIAMGAPQYTADRDLLCVAAQRAGALPMIEKLPDGWETTLSPEYTGGVDLSGGQWQRIALARALFAVDAGARVLILDEPTAALDVRAEAEIYERFLELTAGLTTILISHRFSTVRQADRIVVLDQGVVVEDGSHDDLITRRGRYASMFDLQAARFVESPTGRAPGGLSQVGADVEAGHA
jgi:ABC-type multidrug transport system fused ATPase/permease subunit